MKLRMALLAVLVVALVTALNFHRLPWSPLTGVVPAGMAGSEPPAGTSGPLRADSSDGFEVLRDRVLAPYRLPPDRRLLLAVSEVRRLAGGPDSAVTARFAAGRWTLSCGSQEVGTLSELPDFPEMLELLTEWARKQAWARGWADNAGPQLADLERALDRLDAEAALREADRAWTGGSRDAALFRYATRAYALLALQTPEAAGMADPIAARSLATLAFARALGAEDPKREACLLAEVLGYRAAARARARELPASDPLRLYVTGDEAGLERVAAAREPKAVTATSGAAANRPASKGAAARRAATAQSAAGGTATTSVARPALEAPFLHLLRVADRGDYERWSGLLARFEHPGVPQAPVLGTGLRIDRAEARLPVAEKLLRAVAPRPAAPKSRSRSAGPVATAASLGQEIQRVEATLGGPPQRKRSGLFDAELARAHRRSLLYGSLDRIGQHHLGSPGSAEASRWFAVGSRGLRSKRRVPAFQRWYAHLADAALGRADLAALRADVDSTAPGPAHALRSYEALRTVVSLGDPSLRDAVQGLVQRMDSRPLNRAELATIAERDLGALNLAERLAVSAAAALGVSHPALAPWRGRFEGAGDSLRVGLIETGRSLPDSVARLALERRWVAEPASWDAAGSYAAWLEEHRDYSKARRVIERWMARTEGDSGASDAGVAARARIARLHQLEGRPDLGLRVLGDLHRSGRFEAVERTALVLQDLGQSHQALAIAWAAHRQAPRRASGRVLLAELFWRQARYGEAAKVLHEGRASLTPGDWTHRIAPRFVAFFRSREHECRQASEALLRAGFRDQATIGAIPLALGAEGMSDLAVELQSRIPLQGAERVEASILAYGHLKRARGEDAALVWLRGRVGGKDLGMVGKLAHQERHPELLWSLAPDRLSGESGDYQWLMRAWACMNAGASHPRYAETVRHLDRAKGSYYLEIGRHLLGLREEAEILPLAGSVKQRSEIYYFLGLKAEHRGRLRDAADWYLMSVESGATHEIEPRWALRRLMAWADARRSLDRIQPGPPA